MPFPGIFPVGLFSGARLESLSQVLSATDNSGGAFTLPNGIQAGDLIVVLDMAIDVTGPVPTAVTPSGFTNDINFNDGNTARVMLSHKIADGTEGGASVTGMDAPDGESKLTYVFRGNIPISLVSVQDIATEFTTGNPVSQTANASGGTVPLVVLGGYLTSGVAVDPRTFSPAKDGEINVALGGLSDFWLAYKIYNSSPADVSIDMDDEGGNNALCSCYIQCS